MSSAAAAPGAGVYRLEVSHWAVPKEGRGGGPSRPSEDSYLFSPDALVVCDGVGGWAARGIDSGAYSRALCAGAARALQDAAAEERLQFLLPKPLLLLQAGYQHACGERLEGSSTALVALLDGDRLRTASLGDCVLLVIRGEEVVFRTAESLHAFNFPFQLGPASRDGPDSATEQECVVQAGDVLVAASDGLFDNVHDAEIASIVSNYEPAAEEVEAEEGSSGEGLAGALGRVALAVARSSVAKSPFGKQMYQEQGTLYRGGKMDDITVLAANVVVSARPSGDGVQWGCVKMLNFASKTRNCVSKTRNFVFKMMNFVFKMMNFAALPRASPRRWTGTSELKMMNFILKMMDFILQMMTFILKMTKRSRVTEKTCD